MAKAINFRTSSKFLLNAINKAPDKKKEKVFKEKFKIYKSRMQTNADNFFRTENQAKNFMITIDTIETKIGKWMSQGKFDQKELQRQVSGLINRSRNFQKQVKEVEKNEDAIKESADNSMFRYVITHPIKTEHSDECADRLSRSPFTKEEAEAEIINLPQHVNCTCYFQKMRATQTSKRFAQDNF